MNSKALLLGALAVSAVSAPAFALNQAAVDGVAGTTTAEFYISGSSAADNAVADFIYNTLCVSGTTDTYQDIDSTGLKGGNWKVYTCTLAAVAQVPVALQGSNALFYKRNKLGSVFGALPILNNGYVEFLNIRSNRGSGLCAADTAANTFNCTVAAAPSAARDVPRHATNVDECNYQATAPANGASGAAIIPIAAGLDTVCRRPSLGLADTETELFQGDNLLTAPDDFVAATAAQMNTAYGAGAAATRYRLAGQVFGIAVSQSVWNALQGAQGFSGAAAADGSNWPSLTVDQVRDILTGTLTTWSAVSQGTVAATNPTPLAAGLNTIALCRRENGSGTQAGTNVFFNNYPCVNVFHTKAATGAVPAGTFFVKENLSSDYVRACLNDAESGGPNANPGVTMGALGLLGYSKGPSAPVSGTTANYQFVKINGVFPSLNNSILGNYDFWFEMQASYNHLAGNEKTLIDGLVAEMRSPTRISAAKAGGIAALPIAGGAGANTWDNGSNNTAITSAFLVTNPVMGGKRSASGTVPTPGSSPPLSCRPIQLDADAATAPNR